MRTCIIEDSIDQQSPTNFMKIVITLNNNLALLSFQNKPLP
jgi:hypothetical protein